MINDPYKSEERFLRIKKGVDGVSKENERIILQYIDDMEGGRNITGNKGSRSFARLNALHSRLKRIAQFIEQGYNKTLITVTEKEMIDLFKLMRDGKIKKIDGKVYKAVRDYVKDYKSFWHWHQKVMKKTKGKTIPDITEDLDASREKPKFNYLKFQQLKMFCNESKNDYRTLMWFLFDSGARVTETLNIRAKDLEPDEKSGNFQLEIREETAKTFGRKIKLLLCSKIIKDYIENKKLKPNDLLFPWQPRVINQYLKRLGLRLLNVKNLTMYDFRHSSACYWLPRYKSESALKYRFGWKKSDMIYYYTEFLGMKDSITEEDLIDSEEKTKLHEELEKQKQLNQIMEEKLRSLSEDVKKIAKINKITDDLNEGYLTREDPNMNMKSYVDEYVERLVKQRIKELTTKQ